MGLGSDFFNHMNFKISTTSSSENEQNERLKKRMKTNSYKNIKVGITFSTFDLFHAGHVKMIEEAKRQCDYLIVGLECLFYIITPWENQVT